MDDLDFESIERYQAFLLERLASWTPPRPLALAASFAQRWTGCYEEFSRKEEWGDPEALLAGVEMVWRHVLGQSSKASERERLMHEIERVTPHMDDFDAIEPLMACIVVQDALSACTDPKTTAAEVGDMAIQVLENLSEEEWPTEPDEAARFWESNIIQTELRAQLRLIQSVEAIDVFQESTVAELSRRAGDDGVITRPAPPALGMTNQELFERYVHEIETRILTQEPPEKDPGGDPHMTAMSYFGAWLSRYMTRLRMIDGEWGQLRDQLGPAALLSRNRALDAAGSDTPDWDEKAVEMLGMCLENNQRAGTVDVGDLSGPHAYGPSLRSLWLEGRRRGDGDGWSRIGEWAASPPRAWKGREGAAHGTGELRGALARPVEWETSGDSTLPWKAQVNGQAWEVGLNDFPEEPMYVLIVEGKRVGEFHDWPDAWIRPARP